MKLEAGVVERLRAAGISVCTVCGKPIIRMVKQPIGRTGKFRMVWAQRAYCSNSCACKAYRKRRIAKKLSHLRR